MHDDWNDYTQFRDTVHGYIKIHKPIAKRIINTKIFQRLKSIEQTGMRVLYPSATHDRFTHSLGVYHLGTIAFDNFQRNVIASLNSDEQKFVDKKTWIKWKILFQLGALLHDCGHAPYSHTLEFVYDLDSTTIPKKKVSADERAINEQLMTILKSDAFNSDFACEVNGEVQCCGKPHEKMSGFLLVTQFSKAIKHLVASYVNTFARPDSEWADADDAFFCDDLEFMVRMIIGCHYSLETNYPCQSKNDAKKWKFELQIRNGVIMLLNSSIDMDNLDYTLRDTKFSGYENAQIDVPRLLNSFTIVKGYKCQNANIDFSDKNAILSNPVDCLEFEGHIKLNLHGKCNIECLNGMMTARGNLNLRNEHGSKDSTPPKVLNRKFFFTDSGFSAEIGKSLGSDDDHLDMAKVNINPPTKSEGCPAYLFLTGNICGVFTGTIYGQIDRTQIQDGTISEVFKFAYDKSAISVIQSAVDARNYEYLWIYAHHTITYQIRFLVIYMLDLYAKLLYEQEKLTFLNEYLDKLKEWKVGFAELPDTKVPKTAKCKDDFSAICDLIISFIRQVSTDYFDKDEPTSSELSIILYKHKDGTLSSAEFLTELNKLIAPFEKSSSFEQALLYSLYKTYEAFMSDYGLSTDCFTVVQECLEWMYCLYRMYRDSSVDSENIVNMMREMLLKILTGEDAVLYAKDKMLDYLKLRRSVKNRFLDKNLQYMVDIVAVPNEKQIDNSLFHFSSDNDLLVAYKTKSKTIEKNIENATDIEKEFLGVCDEYFSRQFSHSMWKTYAQYVHFFRDWTEKELEYVSDVFRNPTLAQLRSENEDERLNYFVFSEYSMSDAVHRTAIHNFYKRLKEEYAIDRLIWVKQSIRTKELDENKTLIKFGKDVLRISDIELFAKSSHEKNFFYFYYKCADDYNDERELSIADISKIIKIFHELVREELSNVIELADEQPAEYVKGDSMTIRDIVYGEIPVADEYLEIIDTPEFQRLRRIKQLATANLVFPSATHTRFEHSIGVFHIMRKLVEHFEDFYAKLGIDVNFAEDDKKAILMAALLHDIGHGPFSHAFEDAIEDGFNHEDMTCDIILNKKTNIHQILKKINPQLPQKVVSYIDVRNKFKDPEKPSTAIGKAPEFNTDLLWVFGQLVSSQLDADRIDYLLRDAAEVGVPYCSFSLDCLIKALQVVFFNNNYYVCVLQEALPEVESYLYSRYQMYNNIYTYPHKLFSEELMVKIIVKVRDLYRKEAIGSNEIPKAVKCMFDEAPIGVSNFCLLDDSVMMGAILDWSLHPDKILSLLCQSFLNRTGFQKLQIMLNEPQNVNNFKKRFVELVDKYVRLDDTETFLKQACFWIEKVQSLSMYKKSTSPIYILCSNGAIKELSEVSALIKSHQNSEAQNAKETKAAYYIHFGILKEYITHELRMEESHYISFEKDVRNLIQSFDIRNQFEIEVKYTVADGSDTVFDEILEFMKSEFDLPDDSGASLKQQIDHYYDYDESLRNANKTLRIRQRGEDYMVTYKEPTPASYESAEQTVRVEHEIKINENNIHSEWQNIMNAIPALKDFDDKKLQEILEIRNNRRKVELHKDGFIVEMVFDSVTYVKGGREREEKQVELELRSGYEYRINLNLLAGKLQEKMGDKITPTKTSKLERGLALLNQNSSEKKE